jgi:hypothetical protein
MKSVSTVASAVASQYRTGQVQAKQQAPKAINEEAARHVNDIFRALQAAFPAWRSAFPDDAALKAAKASWVKGLIEGGITDMEQIARGVRKARQSESDFFPSVGKFIGWCKPSLEEFGLPMPAMAFHEASMYAGRIYDHEWSHPGVLEAGRRADLWNLRHGDVSEKTFFAIYKQVCDEVIAGAEFEAPEVHADRLERHNNGREVMTEESKEHGRRTLEKLKGLF